LYPQEVLLLKTPAVLNKRDKKQKFSEKVTAWRSYDIKNLVLPERTRQGEKICFS
jgi:hypothetical protein